MERLYDNCCGIDVHKKLMVACFLHGKEKEIRKFGATTSELLKLSDWLAEGGCQKIAMESTGSYWKPLYNVLESSGLDAIVVNARHMKALPGRKTDVTDSEWIADLLRHGLLKPSFIPDRAQRELRELVTYRKSLIKERSAELNRLQKMLEGANIKLSGTVSNILGMSARNILELVADGKKVDAAAISKLRAEKKLSPLLKATDSQLAEDLDGVMSDSQKKTLKIILKHIDQLEEDIAELDSEIDGSMKEDDKKAAETITVIPGISTVSSQQIISVIGSDMSRFPSDAHISAWAGLCPGNNESANKRNRAKARNGNNLLRSTLVICAHSAVNVKKSYFSAQFARISARRGRKRAYVAVAHSMLIAIYHILKDGAEFKDLGSNYYECFNKERKIKSYLKKLKLLGWDPSDAMAGQTV